MHRCGGPPIILGDGRPRASIAAVIGDRPRAWLIHWFPAQGSTQAHKIDTFWDVLIIVSVPIFVLVATVVLFSVIKFRMRPGEEDLDGPPIHGNTRLEVVWTAMPATILIALCAYAYIVLHDIEKAPAKPARELHVDGHRAAVRLDLRSTRARTARSSTTRSSTCPRAAR